MIPYELLFPQNGGPKCTPRNMSNFEWPYLRNGSADQLHVLFQGMVFGVGGSNGVVFGSIKSRMAVILDNYSDIARFHCDRTAFLFYSSQVNSSITSMYSL